MSDAREAVMQSIRAALGRRSDQPPPSPSPPPVEDAPGRPTGLEEHAARVQRFRSILEGVGGHVHVVSDDAGATEALANIASELGAKDVALSDSPLVRRIATTVPDIAVFDGWDDRQRLLECDLGFTGAQFGVAETGTLVLLSSEERHRVASLVPPVHVALLEARDIQPALGDALEAARRAQGGLPHVVTLITGPSRTGDIELTIVVGVHGPKELHVIVVDRAH